MQVKPSEQISSDDVEIILRHLPDWIQDALISCATEIDYPVEAIIEMAPSVADRPISLFLYSLNYY